MSSDYWPESARFKAWKDEKKPVICYTMPGIRLDPLSNEANLDLSKINLEKKINELLVKGKFEKVIDVTSHVLTTWGQGNGCAGRSSELTEMGFRIWTIRFQCMFLLKRHSDVLTELIAFDELDAPDLYHQYKTDRTGSIVPFAFRLIHSEAPRFSPFPWKSIDRLTLLAETTRKILEECTQKDTEQYRLWLSRLKSVKIVLSKTLFKLGEYEESMSVLHEVYLSENDLKEKASIARSLLRMAIHSGDEKAVNFYTEAAGSQQGTELLLHKVYRGIFLGAYPHAQEYMNRIKQSGETSNLINNTAAITALYTGKVNEAVKILKLPKKEMNDKMVTNLKTTSELCFSTARKEELSEYFSD